MTTSTLDSLLYWRQKKSSDNQWHPLPAVRHLSEGAPWLNRLDMEAAIVDAAPLTVGAGTVAYLRQLPHLGVTARANPFTNHATMMIMGRSSTLALLGIAIAQLTGFEYRYYIPRWAHDRERRRNDHEARQHVNAGIAVGLVSLLVRGTFRLGPAFSQSTLLDIVLGGGIADMLLREYYRAHNM